MSSKTRLPSNDLERGRIAASGTPDELRHNDNLLVRGFAAQSLT
jgi:hypothetical protein